MITLYLNFGTQEFTFVAPQASVEYYDIQRDQFCEFTILSWLQTRSLENPNGWLAIRISP